MRAVSAPWLFASLLTLIIVLGELFFDVLGGYERIAVALGSALLAESLLSRFVTGRKGHWLSAYISGNSITILTKSAMLWPFCVGSLIAIASKFVLRYRGSHLWNPTNFAISLMLLVAPGSMSILSHQWGNTLWVVALIFVLGFIVVIRARLLHISGTYALAFVVLAAIRARILDVPVSVELAPMTGPMYMLLIFFMITDPKTVVSTRRGRIGVAILIAVVEMGIRLLDVVHVPALAPLLTAPPIYALAIVGPIAKVVDIRRRTA